jgi:type I restriction enzyme S subunit
MVAISVALGELLRQDDDPVAVVRHETYPIAGVYGFGRGLFAREPILGSQTSYTEFNRIHAGRFLVSRVKAWEGAVGVVPPELDGYFVSKEFPSFVADAGRVDVRWLNHFFASEQGRRALVGCTKGIGARRERVKEAAFLNITLSLPPLAEQKAIVARLDELAEKTRQVETHLDAAEQDAERLLSVQFHKAIADAPMRSMTEVAPLVRREQPIDMLGSYPELGIRSFGKGTFHKPPLSGSEVGSKRLFRIEPGDLVFSNVFAWEGAIAVAQPADAERFGSHRFITCRADAARTSAEFLRYYFLTDEGLLKIGEASPGGAGRNRTLGIEKLMALEVPVPPQVTQRSFDHLQSEVAALKAKHAAIRAANAALLPATLERIFRSEA